MDPIPTRRLTRRLALAALALATALDLAVATPLSWVLLDLEPTPNSIDGEPSWALQVRWADVLDPTSATEETFRVYGRWSGLLEVERLVHGGLLRLTGHTETYFGEPLTAIVTSGLRNEQGEPLPEPYVWEWTHTSYWLGGGFSLQPTQVLSFEGAVWGLAPGDLDRDRDIDLFVSREFGIEVVSNLDGFLSVAQSYATPWRTFDAALGDFDSDFDLDALTVRAGIAGLVWINDGTGQFAPGQELGFASSALKVATADLDGDGDLDAYVGTLGGDEVWINQGGAQGGTPGSFAWLPPLLGNSATSAVAIGDFDADLDLDLFSVNGLGQPDRVYLNDGAGGFTDSGQQLGTSWGTSVALGDLDLDGDLDAFVGTDFHTPGDEIWLNDGDGVLADSGLRFGSGNTSAVVLADLDGDRDIDILTTENRGRQWINNGGLSFTERTVDFGPLASADALALFPIRGHLLEVMVENGTVRYYRQAPVLDCRNDCTLAKQYTCATTCVVNCEVFEGLRSLSSGLRGLVNLRLEVFLGVRELVLAATPAGQRYTAVYDLHDAEVRDLVVANPSLWDDAVDALSAWQANLEALLEDQGSTAVITAPQMAAIDDFLTALSALGSPALQQMIAEERARLGPLDGYVGMTMDEAREAVIGSPTFDDGFEWGDARDWSSTQP